MNTIKKIAASIAALLMILFIAPASAQQKTKNEPAKAKEAPAKSKAEIKIKTSAECGMCKATLEKALAYEKGVKKAELNLETKEVTVTYNPKKTTPEQIKKAITNAGYDADEMKANPKVYQQLPECCKKDGMQNHDKHK